MEERARLMEALEPVLEVVRTVDPTEMDAAGKLEEALPLNGPVLGALRHIVREGIDAGWLAERENGGIRFGRVHKATDDADLGIEVVHMSTPGPGHTHPKGEIDLCFAVSGDPRFDGREQGWTVYGPNTWHVPTVDGGAMDILYFLPGGAIRFEKQPGT